MDKLTTTNWVLWQSQFSLYLEGNGLHTLLEKDWTEEEMKKKKYKTKNCRALNSLYQAVDKELHNEILSSKKSFHAAWSALATACGQNSVVTICSAYREVNRMTYQIGTPLQEHIARFKTAYTRLIEQTAHNPIEFGTVTPVMAAAMFLESLENDTNLASLVQSCYDIKPFNLKTVTDCILMEAVCRKNRLENQSAIMVTTSTKSQQQLQSKSSKKKNKQKMKDSTPQPKAVAPTLNNKKSNTPLSSRNNQPESIDQRFKRMENSISELTGVIKKLTLTNMLGIVHSNEGVSNKISSPFDYSSDRSTYFIGTVQHSSRDYFSRFLVFDTGATQSCVMNLELLQDVKPLTDHYLNTFSSSIEATHVGTLKIGEFFVSPVYYVPNGCANVVSATQLIDHGLKPMFKMDQFLIESGNKIIATFPQIGKLYLSPVSEYINVVNMKIPDTFNWHFALGHASDKYVKLFLRQANISSKSYTKGVDCKICQLAKIHKTPHNRCLPTSTTPFHRIHSDVLQIGPASKLGHKYILILIDDTSRFNRIYLLKAKSESEKRILEFFAEIKNKINRVPAYFHSDRGGEFSSTKFLSSLQELGVSIERGPADSPQTNGVAERFNGVLLEKIKCMLLQSQVPQSLWHEAACHASDILNVLPHSSLNWQSPSLILVKAHSLIEPDRTSMPLVPFGARVIVHRSNTLKINPSGVEMLFLGFEEFSDAARFLDPLTQRIVITRDYVVPTIELGPDAVTIHKDLKTLPTEVNTSSPDISGVETAWLFIRGHRSRSKPSPPPES
jgi:hypothetical protein